LVKPVEPKPVEPVEPKRPLVGGCAGTQHGCCNDGLTTAGPNKAGCTEVKNPTEPVEPKPVEPVEPKPVEPVEPEPVEPVEPKLVKPIVKPIAPPKRSALPPPPCKDPFNTDPESWDCACHEVMVAKCSGPNFDGVDFETCYRSLLCNNPHVCSSWKAKVCSCTDSDEDVKTASEGKASGCAAAVNQCPASNDMRPSKIGNLMRIHCPKTCQMPWCAGQQADIELADAVTGKQRARLGWAPTPSYSAPSYSAPTSPTVNPTEPPLADQGPTGAGSCEAF